MIWSVITTQNTQHGQSLSEISLALHLFKFRKAANKSVHSVLFKSDFHSCATFKNIDVLLFTNTEIYRYEINNITFTVDI